MDSFLTTEWFALLGERVASAGPEVNSGERFGLGQVVTGESVGDVTYTIVLGGGEAPRLILGSIEEADVILIEDREAALAISSGTPAAELLSAGQVKIRGSVRSLLAAGEQLNALGRALGSLAENGTDTSRGD